MKQNKWQDHYARKAKKKGWLARSIFKLEELDKKYSIIHKGNRILDLGCFPGSWIQYGLKKVGLSGEVIGIDLQQPQGLLATNFRFIKADVLKIDSGWLAEQTGPRDVVLSDLAPKTTGIKSSDAFRSFLLAQRALEIALKVLVKGGYFVCKVFEGEDTKALKEQMENNFLVTRLFRPKAVRKGSREIYLLGLKRTK